MYRYGTYQGRRIQKSVSDPTGKAAPTAYGFVYDGWNLVAIFDARNGTLLYSFTWGLDLSGTSQGAGGVGGLISMTVHFGPNAGTYFYVFDGNGNVVALVNAANGSVAAQYEYGPFGQVLRATGPMALVNPFLFSTKFYDWETGYYYYGFRYYDPSTGRWLSRDPLEEQGGQNLYAFVQNCPLCYYDYLGREGYWSDVGTTVQGMGQGVGKVSKDLGYFAGDLLLGLVVVVVPDCCCDKDKLLTKIDDFGYKGSSLTADARTDSALKVGGKVFIAPVVAAISVPVNGYQSIQAAANGDLNAAGNRVGQALTTTALLAAPFAKGAGGTGGFTGVGTFGEAIYNLTPTAFGQLPAATRINIIRQANRTCESSLIKNMGPEAVSQFQVYPRLPSGRIAIWWYTAAGVCTRGGLQIREFKASPTAPLNGNQPAAIPLLEEYGGAVRSLKGNGIGLPQGTVLPPIRVQVIRQVQFQPSELALPALGNGSSQ